MVSQSDVIGGLGVDGGFSLMHPDPNILVWDEKSDYVPDGYLAGWLKVPVLHDPYLEKFEKSPEACLRVVVHPAKNQPAKNGPLLLHCGGPGSGASCVSIMGSIISLNSSFLVGAPASEDYDYWSISQRGVMSEQDGVPVTKCPWDDHNVTLQRWPDMTCDGRGVEALLDDEGLDEVLSRFDGSPDNGTWTNVIAPVIRGPEYEFAGSVFHNETYVRWLYRTLKVEYSLCFHHQDFTFTSPETGRKYNGLNFVGTNNLARDIELFRMAIGAKKMSIYGISYGTKVASVYATLFEDKVHRLILDGDMGGDPEISAFAHWTGAAYEATWAGLADACDETVMQGLPADQRCASAPGVTNKVLNLFGGGQGTQSACWATKYVSGIEQPGVPEAPAMMQGIAALNRGEQLGQCQFDAGVGGGLEFIGAVIGMDLAGRFTEHAFLTWWRDAAQSQPVGLLRSLSAVAAVSVWPGISRPQPPIGSAVLAPVVLGNLHDPATPYHNAQLMSQAFPSGKLLTYQGYGHGIQLPHNVTAVVERYEEEVAEGKLPTYTDDVGKLLCAKIILEYLKSGELPRDHVCAVAGPPKTVEDKTIVV